MDLHLSQACRQYATQSSTSFFDRQLSDAHIANEESVKNSCANTSAKVVLAWVNGDQVGVRFIKAVDMKKKSQSPVH